MAHERPHQAHRRFVADALIEDPRRRRAELHLDQLRDTVVKQHAADPAAQRDPESAGESIVLLGTRHRGPRERARERGQHEQQRREVVEQRVATAGHALHWVAQAEQRRERTDAPAYRLLHEPREPLGVW